MTNWIEVNFQDRPRLKIGCFIKKDRSLKYLLININENLFSKMNMESFDLFYDSDSINRMRIEFSRCGTHSFICIHQRKYVVYVDFPEKSELYEKIELFGTKNIDFKIEDNNLFFEI